MRKLLFLFFLISSSYSFSQTTAVDYYESGYKKAEKNNHRGAIADFTRAIQLDYTDAKKFSYYHRGYSKFMIGDKRGACSDMKMSSRLGYEYAKKMLKVYCK